MRACSQGIDGSIRLYNEQLKVKSVGMLFNRKAFISMRVVGRDEGTPTNELEQKRV